MNTYAQLYNKNPKHRLRWKGFLNFKFQNVGLIKSRCFLTFCILVCTDLKLIFRPWFFVIIFRTKHCYKRETNYMDAMNCYLISKSLKSKVNVFIAHLLYNETEICSILSNTFMFSVGELITPWKPPLFHFINLLLYWPKYNALLGCLNFPKRGKFQVAK